MKVRYDPKFGDAYIYLAAMPAGGAETYPCDPGDKLVAGINLDFDKSGRLIGIEVLNAKRRLPPELLREAEVLQAPMDQPSELGQP
jgi:uncharacterized protein YuzE